MEDWRFQGNIIMEYNEFYPYYLDYLPEGLSSNEELTTYLSTDKILEQYAMFLFMTLPSPRTEYYAS